MTSSSGLAAGPVPTISVLLTCYNLGRYLDEAVDSVFAQTLQDFEIIIVDDGSTDADTVRLLRGYTRPRTRVIRIDNRGLPGARNEAARHASGRYFCSLDADDRLAPTWFAKAVDLLERHPEVAFVSHWLRAFGDEEWDWTPEACDLESLLTRNTVNGAALVRREAFFAVGGFDESMTRGCEDWDLWLTMVEQGFPGRIIPEVLFFYRRRRESMSQEMLRGDTHVQLVETLIRKHANSFRAHLEGLLVEKELEISRMRRDMHDRFIEDDTWLLPEASRCRDRLVRLRRKAGSLNDAIERGELEQTLERLQAAERGLREEHARVEEERARLEQERNHWQEVADRLHRDISAVHRSASWKVTRPLRVVGRLIRRPEGD